MKREIKFRAYDTEREMYVPQGEIIFKDYGETYFEVSPNCQEYIHDKCHNGEPQYNRFIIEQYTGLKDINDVEIYEGNIVEHGISNKTSKVAFIDGSFALCNQGNTPDACIRHYCKLDFKVIGNIHENPELI